MAYQVVNGSGVGNRSYRSHAIPVFSSLAFLLVGGIMLCKLLWTGTAPASPNLGYHFKVINAQGRNSNIRADDGTGGGTGKVPQVLRWGSNVYKGLYTGQEWTSPRTVDRTIVADTAFARCEIHSVKADDGSEDVIHDWLWFDEKDAVNVAVVNDLGQFVVMKQRKYGIQGETLSPVGGMIEDGETPFEAAKREVAEELGLGSRNTLREREQMEREKELNATKANTPEPSLENQVPDPNNGRRLNPTPPSPQSPPPTASAGTPPVQPVQPQPPSITNSNGMGDGTVPPTESHDWTYLGKYRTAANRGGGFVYTYLLQNAVPLAAGGGTSTYGGVGDGEEQHILQLSMAETQRAIGNAEFKEIKWAATMSFALMQIQARAFSVMGSSLSEDVGGHVVHHEHHGLDVKAGADVGAAVPEVPSSGGDGEPAADGGEDVPLDASPNHDR